MSAGDGSSCGHSSGTAAPGTAAPGDAGQAGRLALRLLPLLLVVAAALVAAALLRPRSDAEVPLVATATVPPQAWLLHRLGGDRIRVEVLLPPGSDVHTYEPAPQQVERLARSRLIVRVGHPGLPLERELLASRTAAGAETVDMMAEARRAGLAAPSDDPHPWTSPAVMAATARAAADALARLDPSGAEAYRANLAAALAEIDAVDAELRRSLDGVPRRRFLVYHPSWGWLAAHYGLEQVAIEEDGKEPSPRRLVALVEEARAERIPAVFVQAGVADRPARVLAAEIGAAVVPLDALAADWPGNLRRTGAALREALGG